MPFSGVDVAVGVASADHVVAHTLLNCYVRELTHAQLVDDHLHVWLPHVNRTLRVEVRRRSLSGAHRFTGQVSEWLAGGWIAIDWHDVAAAIAAELTRATGAANDDFVAQVAASHEVTSTALRTTVRHTERYVASEQSLPFGHRFHPTPKARTAPAGRWQTYAPETGSRFPLRYLAVRVDVVREEGDVPDFHVSAPDGYRVLPVHPWQYELLAHNPTLRAALREGTMLDLGTAGPAFSPTSSVRTLLGPECFLKFSLNVRITNCVRRNAAHELAAAVALTRLLDQELADFPVRFPGCRLLREPGYRTVDLGDRELLEGFGVIVRESLDRHLLPGVTPLLAGAVADEYPSSDAHVSRLVGASATGWLRAYLRLLLRPVLAAFFDHGVVLEPHLQNVLVGVDDEGMPAQMLFRDTEGTKLVEGHPALATIEPDVAGPMTYPRERGWRRVAYCLLVNHVAELVSALADVRPELEPDLWALVRDELAGCGTRHGRPAELAAILAGQAVPAKANLLARWRRTDDRSAGYVPVSLPLR
jgi:siderophore synthetase component